MPGGTNSLLQILGLEKETFPCLFSLMTFESDSESTTDVMKFPPSELKASDSPNSFLLMQYHDLSPSSFPTIKQILATKIKLSSHGNLSSAYQSPG